MDAISELNNQVSILSNNLEHHQKIAEQNMSSLGDTLKSLCGKLEENSDQMVSIQKEQALQSERIVNLIEKQGAHGTEVADVRKDIAELRKNQFEMKTVMALNTDARLTWSAFFQRYAGWALLIIGVATYAIKDFIKRGS